MGFIGLPISLFLYWLMLRSKKESPFPKWGLFRLMIGAVFCIAISTVLSMPISLIITLFRTGAFVDFSGWLQAIRENPAVFKEMTQNLDATPLQATFWSIINMFFSAGLLEEGLKYLACRFAIRKEGMVRTWMDSVVAFAIVGITFELLENIIFGMGGDFLSALLRALAAAHFVFGVIMGYFYGKYRVTGKKGYHLLAFVVPVVYHSLANGLIATMEQSKINQVIGITSSISYIVAAVVTVPVVFYWQKKKTLNVPVKE